MCNGDLTKAISVLNEEAKRILHHAVLPTVDECSRLDFLVRARDYLLSVSKFRPTQSNNKSIKEFLDNFSEFPDTLVVRGEYWTSDIYFEKEDLLRDFSEFKSVWINAGLLVLEVE